MEIHWVPKTGVFRLLAILGFIWAFQAPHILAQAFTRQGLKELIEDKNPRVDDSFRIELIQSRRLGFPLTKKILNELGPSPAVRNALIPFLTKPTLTVRTDPVEADVEIDGTRKGKSDDKGVCKLVLDAGTHTIQIKKEGFFPKPREPATLKLDRGDEVDAGVYTLTPHSQAGALDFQPLPEGLSWEVVNPPRGCDTVEGRLRCEFEEGEHELTVKVKVALPEPFLPFEQTIQVTPGMKSPVACTFRVSEEKLEEALKKAQKAIEDQDFRYGIALAREILHYKPAHLAAAKLAAEAAFRESAWADFQQYGKTVILGGESIFLKIKDVIPAFNTWRPPRPKEIKTVTLELRIDGKNVRTVWTWDESGTQSVDGLLKHISFEKTVPKFSRIPGIDKIEIGYIEVGFKAGAKFPKTFKGEKQVLTLGRIPVAQGCQVLKAGGSARAELLTSGPAGSEEWLREFINSLGGFLKAVQGEPEAVKKPSPFEGPNFVNLFTQPGGVDVHLDGRPSGRTDPGGFLELSQLPVGTYPLRLAKEGYLEENREIRVFPGMFFVQHQVTLQPDPFSSVIQFPEGVGPTTISPLDNCRSVSGSSTTFKCLPGRYSATLPDPSAPGVEGPERQFTVQAGEKVFLEPWINREDDWNKVGAIQKSYREALKNGDFLRAYQFAIVLKQAMEASKTTWSLPTSYLAETSFLLGNPDESKIWVRQLRQYSKWEILIPLQQAPIGLDLSTKFLEAGIGRATLLWSVTLRVNENGDVDVFSSGGQGGGDLEVVSGGKFKGGRILSPGDAAVLEAQFEIPNPNANRRPITKTIFFLDPIADWKCQVEKEGAPKLRIKNRKEAGGALAAILDFLNEMKKFSVSQGN